MKSKALIETERNIKRMHLDLSDAEFEAMLERQANTSKLISFLLLMVAIGVAGVVLLDPVAETLAIGLQGSIDFMNAVLGNM